MVYWDLITQELDDTAKIFNCDFSVVQKDKVWWWRILAILHKIVTFGKGTWLLDNYYTINVISRILYVPSLEEWNEMHPQIKYGLKSHEYQHIYDFKYQNGWRRYGLIPTTFFQKLWYVVGYIVWPPKRALIERRGYYRTLEADAIVYKSISVRMIEFVVEQLSGPTYAWMMGKDKAQYWAEKTARQLEKWAEKEIPQSVDRVPASADYIDHAPIKRK